MNLRDMLKAKKQELAGLSDKIKAGDADAIKASKDLVKEINELTISIHPPLAGRDQSGGYTAH